MQKSEFGDLGACNGSRSKFVDLSRAECWGQISRVNLKAKLASERRATATADRGLSEFYKTFTRPVAKCLLLAMFTYQLAYFAWVKLETDEIREERQAEVASLEEQVKNLQSKAATTTKS
ncbi:hypothetical protein BR93DRAFT_977104 [Coniochaeta sp. PMI_546]|nr:hypothetical protein BR93DRAFT_977104 [Coniochaeta sp. PMI_546]